MQENTPHDQENVQNDPNEQTRLLNDWLAEKKENEPEKLFDEAYKFSERRGLTPETRLIFLQDAWCCAFREILRDMSDEELARGDAMSKGSAALFGSLCSNQEISLKEWDRDNLSRRLDVERRAKIGSRPFDAEPLQIEPNEKRGLSSLGSVKDSRTTIRTQYDVSKQISNSLLVSESATSNFKPRPTLETRTTGDQGTHSGQKDVFLGTQVETSQKVAFKVSRGGTNDAATIREAEFQARIGHQGVPTIISLNKEGVPIIVEPFIKGKSWASLIDSQKSEEKMDVLIQVGTIMTYVHRVSKIAHGDLKPENVMIGEYGEVYVIDWGYAINLEDDEEKRFICGYTEAYCPPEVNPPQGCNDAPKPANASADVFMLGGILHQIVVPSRKTFNETLPEKTNYEVSIWKNYDEFPEFPGVPTEMREVLEKALQYKPENRYQDAGKFVDALKKYQKTRRFNENRKRFEQWKAQVEESSRSKSQASENDRSDAPESEKTSSEALQPGRENKKDRKIEAARITNGLIACINEFALIRKETEDEHAGQNVLEDAIFLDVLKDELFARSFLLERSIGAQDYGQAQALAETQDEVVAKFRPNDKGLGFCEQIESELQTQRNRISKGYRRRKRNNILAVCGIFAVVLMFFSIVYASRMESQKAQADKEREQAVSQKAQAENEATQAKNQVLEERIVAEENTRKLEEEARRVSNRQLFDMYERYALTAQEEKFPQGEISVWAKALKLVEPNTKESSFPQCYNLLEVASKTSILPQYSSSSNLCAQDSGFSADGRSFAFYDYRGYFDVWDTETLQIVSSVNILSDLLYNGGERTYIRSNPFFEDEYSDKPLLSSRLLFFMGGNVWLVSNDKDETKLATYFGNVRISADAVKEFEQYDPNALVMEENEFRKNLDTSFDELNITTYYVTEKDSKGRAFLFVGAYTGETLIFSLPDFTLVGAFKTQNKICFLEASIQKECVIIVDQNDMVCRRYSFDGTLLNEYDFDFPPKDLSEVEPSLTIALSPSGKKLVVGNEQGSIRVWDVDSNKLIAKTPNKRMEGLLGNGIARLYWLDEERFLSLGHNSDCVVWNLEEIGINAVPNSISVDCGISNSKFGLRTASFSPKTQNLILVGRDNKICLIDVNKGKMIARTNGLSWSMSPNVAYLPEKNGLLLQNDSGKSSLISMIDADSFEEVQYFSPIRDLKNDDSTIIDIAAPSVGSEFAFTLDSGEIVFYSADDSKPTHTINAISKEEPPFIAVDPNAKFLVGKTRKGEIVLWDWKTKREIKRWSTVVDKTQVLRKVDSDSESLDFENGSSSGIDEEVGSEQDELVFDDNDFGESEDTVDRLPSTLGLFFVDDDKILEVLDRRINYTEFTNNIRLNLWSISTEQLIRSNEIEYSGSNCFSLSHNGQMLALGGFDGLIQIVSTENLNILGTIELSQAELSYKNTSAHNFRSQWDVLSVSKEKRQACISGLSWSQEDSLLCATNAHRFAAVFNIPPKDSFEFKTSVRTSFIVNRDETESDVIANSALPIFTKANHLLTFDLDGSVKRWDYSPSQESATLLWDSSVKKLSVGDSKRQEWAGISSSKLLRIYSGTNLQYEENDIGDVQYWNAPNGTSGFLTLRSSDGKLSFVDGKGTMLIPNMLDDHSGFPKEGLERFCVSPDGTKIAGIERTSHEVWTLDLSCSNSIWERINWSGKIADLCQLTFSLDSRILVANDGIMLFVWDLKLHQELFLRNGAPFRGIISTAYRSDDKPITDNGEIRFISDNLIVQTGEARGFYVWNVKERDFPLQTSTPLIGNVLAIRTCENLNKGMGKDKPTTFVIAGDDGVLRFYQLSKGTYRFEPIYVVSHLQLSALTRTRKNRPIQNEESTKEFPTDEFVYNTDMSIIYDLSLSDDGKTLYVASEGGVRSYDMEEIWKNIDELPQKWQNVDVERLTGLRFNSSGELTPFVPNHMVRVDKSAETSTPSASETANDVDEEEGVDDTAEASTPSTSETATYVDEEQVSENSSETSNASAPETPDFIDEEEDVDNTSEASIPFESDQTVQEDDYADDMEEVWRNEGLKEAKITPNGLIKWHYDSSGKSSPFIPRIIRGDK